MHTQLIIIGSGPAGLTAAIYAARGGLVPLIISGNEPGGQLILTTDVQNFPGFPDAIKGPALMENMRKQAEQFGTKFIDNVVASVDFSTRPFKVTVGIDTDQTQYTAEAVIIATGSSAVWLGLESETRLRGRGVSACATCDGFFFKGKDVIVVGGGEVAIEEAIFLAKLVKSVKVIHRSHELRAARIMQQKAFNNRKISFFWNSVVEEILGDKKVEGVRIKNVENTAEKSKIKCDGVFIAIGHKPNTQIFRNQIELDKGYIKKYEGSRTSVEGVFVAGDSYDYVYRQAVTAAGSGCKAAIDVIRYLEATERKEV
ncbi:MAG: thioredoxin-disulfide reductase [Candidatus Nitrosopolaris wilkensis]|nr:MAG: thioredoxin-disulfide reductase [Candidatus Nitrosopolaris wilkensis]